MSEVKVEVVKIDSISPHPNADRLEIAQVKGWQAIVGKGDFETGDLAVYFPIDSILTDELEAKIFGPDSKIKLSKHRVKTIRLRGAISQGLLVHPNEFRLAGLVKESDDLTEKLGVIKYEPPVARTTNSASLRQRSPREENPYFVRYTDIEKFQNHPKLFEDGENVVITEKIHGTNFRAGWVPSNARTFWQRLKKRLGLFSKWEFVYGSHRVQLQNPRYAKRTFYQEEIGKNIYLEMVEKYDLKNVIPKGFIVFGEIYGDKVQKGYTYGCKAGERDVVFFDILSTTSSDDDYQGYMDDPLEMLSLKGLPTVPVLYFGKFYLDKIKTFFEGPSELSASQPVKEGVVIRPWFEQRTHMGRKILKYINPAYLLKEEEETEFAH